MTLDQIVNKAVKKVQALLFPRYIRLQREYELIVNTLTIMSSELGVKESVDNALLVLKDSFGYNNASVFLYSEKDQKLRLYSHIGDYTDDITGLQLEMGESLTGKAASERRIMKVGNALTEQECKAFYEDMRSKISVPIVYESRLIGALTIESEKVDAFSERDEIRLTAIANALGQNIYNGMLFEKLREATRYDKLTGLYNRYYMQSLLEMIAGKSYVPEAVVEGKQLERMMNSHEAILAVFDLNKLKKINDQRKDHSIGDLYLRSLADILAGAIGDRGVVARYGGDEFVALLPSTTEPEFDSIITDMNQRIAAWNNEHNATIPLGISVGISVVKDKRKIFQHLSEADSSMYDYKNKVNLNPT